MKQKNKLDFDRKNDELVGSFIHSYSDVMFFFSQYRNKEIINESETSIYNHLFCVFVCVDVLLSIWRFYIQSNGLEITDFKDS